MRRMRDLAAILLIMGITLAGCANQENHIRPPKLPEEFNAPPETDPRYSGPIEYPREVMEQDMLLKRAKEASKTPNPLNSPRAPGRMPGAM